MEKTKEKETETLYSPDLGIIKNKITSLDLSYSSLKDFCTSLNLPPKLTELNLSHNNLKNVPEIVFNLKHVQMFDISFNNIKYFDHTPSFCHNVEYINISNNMLQRPPAWIWLDSPKKLSKLDISCNIDITKEVKKKYFDELKQCKTNITEVKIHNCRLSKYIPLLGTFPKARVLQIGCDDMSYFAANSINDLPCEGFSECCDLENLNIIYTKVYNIKPSIETYTKLVEINLKLNELRNLPIEFCNLYNLEVCILSFNHILYLPEEFVKLKKLRVLLIDSNELCMLPENICSLPNLEKLDLYDNYLCDVPLDSNKVQEMDLAQNYLEEPEDDEYILKKQKLRKNINKRWDGRKYEKVNPESIYSCDTTDEESYYLNEGNDVPDNENRPPSSTEDWDSDEYWVPHYNSCTTAQCQLLWLNYVNQKMMEGNFCPMDNHIVPVAEKVKYEKMCNPQIQYESDGQFDDYSSDDS